LQIANYNISVQVKYLLVCNGIDIHFFEIDFDKKQFKELQLLPKFEKL
jgi:hypothetical protein